MYFSVVKVDNEDTVYGVMFSNDGTFPENISDYNYPDAYDIVYELKDRNMYDTDRGIIYHTKLTTENDREQLIELFKKHRFKYVENSVKKDNEYLNKITFMRSYDKRYSIEQLKQRIYDFSQFVVTALAEQKNQDPEDDLYEEGIEIFQKEKVTVYNLPTIFGDFYLQGNFQMFRNVNNNSTITSMYDGKLGFNTTEDGFTYYAMIIEEMNKFPIFVILYLDNDKLRGYTPIHGNSYNVYYDTEYVNDNRPDDAFMKTFLKENEIKTQEAQKAQADTNGTNVVMINVDSTRDEFYADYYKTFGFMFDHDTLMKDISANIKFNPCNEQLNV